MPKDDDTPTTPADDLLAQVDNEAEIALAKAVACWCVGDLRKAVQLMEAHPKCFDRRQLLAILTAPRIEQTLATIFQDHSGAVEMAAVHLTACYVLRSIEDQMIKMGYHPETLEDQDFKASEAYHHLNHEGAEPDPHQAKPDPKSWNVQ